MLAAKKFKFSSDTIFDAIVYLSLTGVFFLTFYPFWNIFVISINDAQDTLRGGLYIWPRVLTFSSYRVVLQEREFLTSFYVSVLRTAVGTPLALLCTSMAAYVLSRKDLIGRKLLSLIFIFTMFFGGGLIPYYMVLKMLNLIDTFWVYVVPNIMDVFNMLLIMTFIRDLPAELEESATLDGANDLIIFFRIIIPLAKPILATIALFVAVGHWNSWFDSYAFTYSTQLKTLQAYLVKILNQYNTGDMVSAAQELANSAKRNPVSSESLRMATSIVATIPILVVYPFLQKYFVKGIMIGAVKA